MEESGIRQYRFIYRSSRRDDADVCDHGDDDEDEPWPMEPVWRLGQSSSNLGTGAVQSGVIGPR